MNNLSNPVQSVNLFNWRSGEKLVVRPWKPVPLTAAQWPPNYKSVFAWRMAMLAEFEADPLLIPGAKRYYAGHKTEFVMHWMDTYDPRKAEMKWIPFVLFEKQAEILDFFEDLRKTNESGLMEKGRDMGATWLACGYSLASFLFISHDSIGWGSRKADLVDELGNPDSIFEKMRLMIRRLPRVFLPIGWNEKKHTAYMRFINPENGASINGEAGDNIGRGGRKSMYIVDEAAHLERPEKIEAALGDNTRVRVDISSVNGLGNPFHRRRVAGVEWKRNTIFPPGYTRVMVVDWRAHPEKTQEWYDQKRAKYEREGMLHLFAQEVDRDYSASLTNTIIPKEYIMAAVDAHKVLGISETGNHMAGLDVADGGVDRNGLVIRQGVIVRFAEEWGERDPGVTTRRTLVALRSLKRCTIQYDSIGVGSSVKSEYNRLRDENVARLDDFKMVPWNAGGAVLDPFYRVVPEDPDSIINQEMFGNIKAQAWWSLRIRFYKTWAMITKGVTYPLDELISLDSAMGPVIYKLIEELAQPVKKDHTSTLKMIVDKQPEGMKSPNLGDACVMCYFPIPEAHGPLIGKHGIGY